MNSLPKSLGELRRSQWSEERIARRSVRQELRENLMCKMEKGEALFSGVHGYDDTVLPQIINAILSRHHFILLGLRGQAKSRILRGLVGFMDPQIPVVEGCEIHDNPYAPLCRLCRERIAAEGDATPIAWLSRDHRYVEKLATPDVTIADMIGDVDPIKAARSGKNLSDELTIHYGLLPRANRGIFAINELPDLAGKIQVGLFNIMQEGDVQIKGYPVRLALDVLLVFTANPEDYTARGKIITPLKDRIGSEIRTHYPATVAEGMSITAQESWTERDNKRRVEVPEYIREIVEEVAFQAREDKRVDRRSGVSQRLPISALENVLSSAEQRAVRSRDSAVVARVADVYAAIPSMTGKFELEYEGELRGRRKYRPRTDSRGYWQDVHPIFRQRELAASDPVVRNGRRTENSRERVERRSAGAAEENPGAFRPSRACWRCSQKDDAANPGERSGVHTRRPVGAQAHQPQRGTRLFCRSAQDSRATRSA